MQATCGNCGKSVEDSDITCPHCDVLLAAYASPTGATSATAWAGSGPVADTVSPVSMDEPPPAPTIEIPDEVEAVSSAPRPLFDTNVTIDELMQAAEGNHDENLVVVDEEKIASKPVVFDRPDYARPPSAEPVPVIEEADPALIARPTDEPDTHLPPVLEPLPEERAAAPAGETWLAETLTPAPDAIQPDPRIARDDRERTDRADAVRGRTEEYLRKLHAQAGYDSNQAALSRPVEAEASRKVPLAGAWKGGSGQTTQNPTQLVPQGCTSLLGLLLFVLWVRVVFGILGGDVNPGIVFLAVALSFVARFLGMSFPWAGKR